MARRARIFWTTKGREDLKEVLRIIRERESRRAAEEVARLIKDKTKKYRDYPEGRRSGMTRKERILHMIQDLPEDVTYDRVMYHLDVMKSIEVGLDQVERGQVITHEELEEKLGNEGWLDASNSSGPRKRKKTSTASNESSAAVTPRNRRGRSSAE